MSKLALHALSSMLIAGTFTGCNTTNQVQNVSPNNRICFEIQVPSPNWIVGIQEVRVDEMDRLHVYAEAKEIKQDGLAVSAVISSIGDCVRVARNGREIVSYFAGATWNWEQPGISNVSGIEEYRSKLSSLKTKVIFPRD